MTVYRTDRAVGAAPGDTPLCREDTRLLTGRGEFLDDVAFSGGMIARTKRDSASLTAMRCRLDIARSATADATTAFGAGCISSDSTVVSTRSIADAPVETRRLARRQGAKHSWMKAASSPGSPSRQTAPRRISRACSIEWPWLAAPARSRIFTSSSGPRTVMPAMSVFRAATSTVVAR